MFSALKDGAAVVLGGSGALGGEICRVFAEVGSAVAFSFNRGAERAEALEQALRGGGERVMARRVDLADRNAVDELCAAAESRFGAIHTLIYAAGPLVRLSAIADLPAQEFADALNADIIGFFTAIQAGIPYLRRSRGSIVALSTAGTRRYPPLDVMSAGPKASIEMLVQGIAREEGRNGIRANSVGVGHIDAGQGLSIQEDPRGRRLAERVLAATPLRRLGTPRDVANAVLYFASPMAGFVSGEMLCVDGGGHV